MYVMNENINIAPKDIVAGWYFRKFIKDYKLYDAKQKHCIRKMRNVIMNQKQEIANLKESLAKAETKRDLCSAENIQAQTTIAKLRKEVTRLLNTIGRKNAELRKIQ